MDLLSEFKSRPLRRAISLYWATACAALTPEPFQLEDWFWLWHKLKACILRARGGSKTHDFVNWVIFRVLRTGEKWMWMSCRGGQLFQAKIYFQMCPFVRRIQSTRTSTFLVHLWSGDIIRAGIISTSNLGLRMDGIFYDEFEDLKPKQRIEVFPQMFGMMTTSTVHMEIFAGTRWLATLFDEYCDTYSAKIRPWDTIPWLVQSGAIQQIIDDGNTEEWLIDCQYRCIAAAPYGLLFPKLYPIPTDFKFEQKEVQYGLDFGSFDRCGGIVLRGKKCYLVEEYEFQLESNNAAFDFLKGRSVEAESGGYNDSDKFIAKSILLGKRIGAMRAQATNAWKSERQMKARGFKMYVDKKLTPNLYADVKNSYFDRATGAYLKDKLHPCHWLESLFHAIHVPKHKLYEERVITNLDEDPNWVENQSFGAI